MILCFMGLNGSGKGTQALLLRQRAAQSGLNMETVHPGGLLASDPECKALIDQGKLIDDKRVCDVLDKSLATLDHHIVVVDGFPRSVGQADHLINLSRRGHEVLVCVFEVSEDVAVARCVERDRGPDDAPEVVRARVQAYRRETEPAVEHMLRLMPRRLLIIDGGRPVEVVHASIAAHLKL